MRDALVILSITFVAIWVVGIGCIISLGLSEEVTQYLKRKK